MAELFEVILVDKGTRWHTGVISDEITETDLLLTEQGKVLVFGSRAALEHHAQEHRLKLHDDLPDEIDLDLDGWLSAGSPEPDTAEVSDLWHLLYDDPKAGRPLASDELGEAYDDLVEEAPDWFAQHGDVAREALRAAVQTLRSSFKKV